MDYYQCQMCRFLFPNILVIEKHLETCSKSTTFGTDTTEACVQSRGKLPIKKIIIPDCSVPIVRYRINHDSPEQSNSTKATPTSTTLPLKFTRSQAKSLPTPPITDNLIYGTTEIEKIPCPLCHRKFRKKGFLTRHMERHSNPTPKRERLFLCKEDNCGKSFMTDKNLQIHMRSHTEPETYFKCQVCDKQFRTPRRWVKHSKFHFPKRPYQCPFSACSKKFFERDVFYGHVWSHKKKRKHECHHCGKVFKFRNMLLKHRRNEHEKIKRFQCGGCGRGFTLKTHWDSHSRSGYCSGAILMDLEEAEESVVVKAEMDEEDYETENAETELDHLMIVTDIKMEF